MARRNPMRPRSFKCDDPTWDGSSAGAEALGENLSEEIRRFLRRRYRSYIKLPAQPTHSDDRQATS
jgi:hypothetical protein